MNRRRVFRPALIGGTAIVALAGLVWMALEVARRLVSAGLAVSIRLAVLALIGLALYLAVSGLRARRRRIADRVRGRWAAMSAGDRAFAVTVATIAATVLVLLVPLKVLITVADLTRPQSAAAGFVAALIALAVGVRVGDLYYTPGLRRPRSRKGRH